MWLKSVFDPFVSTLMWSEHRRPFESWKDVHSKSWRWKPPLTVLTWDLHATNIHGIQRYPTSACPASHGMVGDGWWKSRGHDVLGWSAMGARGSIGATFTGAGGPQQDDGASRNTLRQQTCYARLGSSCRWGKAISVGCIFFRETNIYPLVN